MLTLPNKMDPLRRPLPLISKRVEFEDAEPDDLLPSLPKITHRIEFSERLSDDIDRNGRSASLSSQSDSLGSEESGNINSDARAGVQDEDQDMDLTGSSSIYEDDVEDDSHQPSAFSTDRIPKPPGEPGRPHSGGYNLPTALVGWSKSLYTKVNVRYVNFFVNTHRTPSRNLSKPKLKST